MTPKAQYEARKKERLARQEALATLDRSQEATMETLMDILDRLATAAERIADALDRTSAHP